VGKRLAILVMLLVVVLATPAATGCGSKLITDPSQLVCKQFAVPSSTVARKLVEFDLPEARVEYYDTALAAFGIITFELGWACARKWSCC
jgi:hypothetical protein